MNMQKDERFFGEEEKIAYVKNVVLHSLEKVLFESFAQQNVNY